MTKKETIKNEEKEEKVERIINIMENIDNIDGSTILSLSKDINNIYSTDKTIILSNRTCQNEYIDIIQKNFKLISKDILDYINDNLGKVFNQDRDRVKGNVKKLSFIFGVIIEELLDSKKTKQIRLEYFESGISFKLKNIPGNSFISKQDIKNECVKNNEYVKNEYLILKIETLKNILKENKAFLDASYFILQEK